MSVFSWDCLGEEINLFLKLKYGIDVSTPITTTTTTTKEYAGLGKKYIAMT